MYQSHPHYRDYSYDIPPGGTVQIDGASEFITCLAATLPFKISFDDAPRTNFAEGLSYDAQVAFNRVRIDNDNDTSITVKVGLGRGGIKDTRFVATGSIMTTTVAPPVLSDIAKATIAGTNSIQFLAADTRRKEAIIRHLGTTPTPVWIKAVPGFDESGLLLNEGEVVTLESSAAVHIYNPNGTAVVLAGLEVLEAT